MPDPTKQTVSGSQMPALFGASPWETRWEMYQHFKNGLAIEKREDETMGWGKRLQPAMIAYCRDELRIDLLPNVAPDGSEVYYRHPTLPIGCTDDGFAQEQRGLIKVECKNVSVRAWLGMWEGGRKVPLHVEIQVQQQLMVPIAGRMPIKGYVFALVGGSEPHFFERDPLPQLHEEIAGQAVEFMGDVAKANEPPMVGTEREYKLLGELFPPSTKTEPLDLRGHPDEAAVADAMRQYAWAAAQRLSLEKAETAWKAELVKRAGEFPGIRVSGFRANVTKSATAAAFISLPRDLQAATLAAAARLPIDADAERERLQTVALWSQQTRKASVSTRVTVNEVPGETPVDALLD